MSRKSDRGFTSQTNNPVVCAANAALARVHGGKSTGKHGYSNTVSARDSADGWPSLAKDPTFSWLSLRSIRSTGGAISRLRLTPGVINLVGSQQPTPVAEAVVQQLREKVCAVNDAGGLPRHKFQVGDNVIFKAGPFQGLDGIFAGPLTPSQRVQVLLHFLGREQAVEVDIEMLAAINQPKRPNRRPRCTHGKDRPIQIAWAKEITAQYSIIQRLWTLERLGTYP